MPYYQVDPNASVTLDYTTSMQQTFEFYRVDSSNWMDAEKLDTFTAATIKRDSTVETLGSASFDVTGDMAEQYVRTYLIAKQAGVTHKICLGTHLVQGSDYEYDGTVRTMSLDGYTPLIELKEKKPDLGFAILKGDYGLDRAYQLTMENMRAPVTRPSTNIGKLTSDFSSTTDDTWLSFISDLLALSNYSFNVEPEGDITYKPAQSIESMASVWTFDDDNSSILYPTVKVSRDIFSIPNVYEVYYSKSNATYIAKAENTNIDSPTSIINRGRRIVQREVNPSITGVASQGYLNHYAKQKLESVSSLLYEISFSHGYCPVTVGDCITLNYSRAGLEDIKAKVVSQTIKCSAGCQVDTVARYTKKLWEEE